MAAYMKYDGTRYITGDDGWYWRSVDGAWVRSFTGIGSGPTYTLEKRRRGEGEGAHSTGWYLTDDIEEGGFFGEFISPRILDAVDIANDMIRRTLPARAEQ